jgi:hypothetical protein
MNLSVGAANLRHLELGIGAYTALIPNSQSPIPAFAWIFPQYFLGLSKNYFSCAEFFYQ